MIHGAWRVARQRHLDRAVDGPAARLTRPMPPSPPLTVAGCNVTELIEMGGAALTVSGALRSSGREPP